MLVVQDGRQNERSRAQSRQQLMIESLKIKNFRSFEDLSLEGLGRLNVVVGKNASGKTALLEAIFLGLGGSPELVNRFRAWRGLGGMPVIPRTRRMYEELWNDIFFRLNADQAVEISTEGHPENKRSVKIYYSPQAAAGTTIPVSGTVSGQKSDGDSAAMQPPVAAKPSASDSSVIVPVVFEFTDGGGGKVTYRLDINPMGMLNATIVETSGLASPALSSFFPSCFTGTFGPQEAAVQYSNLSKADKEDEFLKLLRQVYPDIQKLSHELNAGVSMVYCKLADMEKKLPAGMVSGGIYKLLAILLGIAATPKGIVLVDELENGFYYETLPKIWGLLLTFAKEYDVQVFASTHSLECLRALSDGLGGNEDQFRLLRAERDKDGKPTVRLFPGESLHAAIEADIEVR
jgi:hypothetical protein